MNKTFSGIAWLEGSRVQKIKHFKNFPQTHEGIKIHTHWQPEIKYKDKGVNTRGLRNSSDFWSLESRNSKMQQEQLETKFSCPWLRKQGFLCACANNTMWMYSNISYWREWPLLQHAQTLPQTCGGHMQNRPMFVPKASPGSWQLHINLFICLHSSPSSPGYVAAPWPKLLQQKLKNQQCLRKFIRKWNSDTAYNMKLHVISFSWLRLVEMIHLIIWCCNTLQGCHKLCCSQTYLSNAII